MIANPCRWCGRDEAVGIVLGWRTCAQCIAFGTKHRVRRWCQMVARGTKIQKLIEAMGD